MESEGNSQAEYWTWLSEWMRETIGIDPDGSILSENDWMLIIKLHATMEAALNSTLLLQFGAPELKKTISKLDTSNTATGKVAFAKALKILEPQSAVFIQKLSELRNLCVHDIKNFNFDLIGYLSELEEVKRNELLNIVAKEIKPDFELAGARMTAKDLVKVHPRLSLVVATMNVLMQLHFHHEKLIHRDLKSEVCRKKAQLYDQQNPPNPTEQ